MRDRSLTPKARCSFCNDEVPVEFLHIASTKEIFVGPCRPKIVYDTHVCSACQMNPLRHRSVGVPRVMAE